MAFVLVAMACGGEDPREGEQPPTETAAEEEADVGGEEGTPGEDDEPTREDEPPPPGEDEESSTGEDEEPPPEDEEAPPRRRSFIAWLLDLGPSAPSGPSEFRAFEHLLNLDCAGLMERLDDDEHDQALNLDPQGEALYRAVGTACLAAFEDRSELWPEAHELATLAGDGTGSCIDLAARRVLDDLLDAHEADPTAIFEPATGGGEARAAPCPRIDHLDPDTGPRDGQVRVVGENLDGVDEVWLYVGEAPLDVVDGDALALALVSPRELLLELNVPRVSTLCIVLHTVPDWDADGAVYTLEEDPEDGPLEQVPATTCPPAEP